MESILRKEPLNKAEKDKAEKLVEDLHLPAISNGHITFHYANGKIANVEVRVLLR
jgi:hypothetical protein